MILRLRLGRCTCVLEMARLAIVARQGVISRANRFLSFCRLRSQADHFLAAHRAVYWLGRGCLGTWLGDIGNGLICHILGGILGLGDCLGVDLGECLGVGFQLDGILGGPHRPS